MPPKSNASPEILMAEVDERPTWRPIRACNCGTQGHWWTQCVGSLRSCLADPRSLDGLSASLEPGDRLALTGFANNQAKAQNQRSEFGEVLIMQVRKVNGQRENYRPGRISFEPLIYRHFTDHARGDFDD